MTGVAYASSRLVGTAMIASTTPSAVMIVSTPASTRSPSGPVARRPASVLALEPR